MADEKKPQWGKTQVTRGKLHELLGHLTTIRDALAEEKVKLKEQLQEAQEQEAGG